MPPKGLWLPVDAGGEDVAGEVDHGHVQVKRELGEEVPDREQVPHPVLLVAPHAAALRRRSVAVVAAHALITVLVSSAPVERAGHNVLGFEGTNAISALYIKYQQGPFVESTCRTAHSAAWEPLSPRLTQPSSHAATPDSSKRTCGARYAGEGSQ
jgi:hypothetical protein